MVLVRTVGVVLKTEPCYPSGETISERLELFGEGIEVLFLLAITGFGEMIRKSIGLFGVATEVLFFQTKIGSCPLMHYEESASSCGAGVRSWVDVVVAAIVFDIGLIVDDTVGDTVGEVDGLLDHEDLADAKEVAGVIQARKERLMLDTSCLDTQEGLQNEWIIYLPWSLYLVPLLARPICSKTTRSLSQFGRGMFFSSLKRNLDHKISQSLKLCYKAMARVSSFTILFVC